MANKNNSAKKIDLSSVKKINFAKLKRLKAVNIISKFAIYFVLICIGFIFLEPIFEMISKSIMTTKDLIDPSITWIAKHATLDNFKNAIGTLDIPTSILNSIWYSALLAIAQTFVSATTGFALSRYTFRGRNFWFVMLIMAFILPVPLLTVPRIMMFSTVESILGFKLINTVVPQFLLALLGQGTYSTMLVLIFYNFFNMIPKSLDEAAMIDCANPIQIFSRVIFPVLKPTTATVAILSFMWTWNDFSMPLVLLSDESQQTLQLAQYVFKSQFSVDYNLAFASYLLVLAPVLIVYIFCQKWIMNGVVAGAVK